MGTPFLYHGYRAIVSWAPYALISTEIASLKARREGWHGSAEKEEVGGAVEWVDESTAGIMGIRNMAISLPQVCAALGYSLLFKLVEMTGRDDPAAFAFKLAGFMLAVAAWMGRDLR